MAGMARGLIEQVDGLLAKHPGLNTAQKRGAHLGAPFGLDGFNGSDHQEDGGGGSAPADGFSISPEHPQGFSPGARHTRGSFLWRRGYCRKVIS